MNCSSDEREDTYLVQCVWCGSEIRNDKKKDTSAVCLQCFYKILSNHFSAQKRSAYGEFVSDR